MRIVIVTPSAAFARSAGARVRYQPIAAASREAIVLCPLDDLTLEADAYIFSKTYQAEAPAIAHRLASEGKRVALDVFDDYFTDWRDARLERFRRWFAEMTAVVGAVSVSTPQLGASLKAEYGVASTVVPDPHPHVSTEALVRRLQGRATDPDALHLAWFGIASNPYHPAGLADLAAFADRLGGAGAHRLTILTNGDGADLAALSALSACPIDVTWQAWSPAAETALLAQCDAAVLPVNGQPFSAAKSLNRALTALCSGAQVLSLGHPLYAALDPFIYRSLSDLVVDAKRGDLRLRLDMAAPFAADLDARFSPRRCADTLVKMMRGIESPPPRPRAIVLGTCEGNTLPVADALCVATPLWQGGAVDLHLGTDEGVSGKAAAILEAAQIAAISGAQNGPALTGHGVLDQARARAILSAGEEAVRAALPDHSVFTAHEGTLPP
ncbi:MAG: hypothetical protein ROR55_18015 [Devosia sp.]